MNKHDFDSIVVNQYVRCVRTLETKAKEYVHGEDRLEHFKASAAEQCITPENALWGMASKHLTSLGAMCRNGSDDMALWDEKLTDAINYMFLLSALIKERVRDDEKYRNQGT